MNKIFFSCIALLLFASTKSFSQGIWTWMAGTDSLNTPPVFGMQGVSSPNNHPSIYSSYCWTDLNGNFWLYGGTTWYADMWMFNPSTLEWTWVQGNAQIEVAPIYGTQGVPSPTNTPGSRGHISSTWVDGDNNLWLYGGTFDVSFVTNYADLWKFDITTNEWTWMSGTDQVDSAPVYGQLGAADESYHPGARSEIGNVWKDNSGNFWLYGGTTPLFQTYSDMWKYNPSSNEWSWQFGDSIVDQAAVTGSAGVYSPDVTPGALLPYSLWTYADGTLWMFGGAVPNSDNYSDDLWRFNPAINQWAWMNGNPTANDDGIGGGVCVDSFAFYPGRRFENRAVWKDSLDNFWMYGGDANAVAVGWYSDMWVYITACNRWARMQPDSFMNIVAQYGTLGVPDVTNTPGALSEMAHWQDSDGNFWMSGGAWPGPNAGITTAMWRYVPDMSCLLNLSCDSIHTSDIVTSLQSDVQIFPNPADESLKIIFNSDETVQLKLYNALGQLLQNDLVRKKTTIDLKNISAGIYYVILQNQTDVVAKKFIISHR